MKTKDLRWLERLASVQVTLVCLGLAMLLVIFGTLAQVNMGAFAAQKAFFNGWWVYATWGGIKLPVFPGGLTIGFLWVINLLAAFAVRFTFRRRDAGILISHVGVVLLMLGQFVTQMLARESHMPIEIGQTSHYSESFRDTELAIVMTSDPKFDEVTSIPYAVFSRPGPLHLKNLPFSLVVQKFFSNAHLQMGEASGPTLANQGIGTRVGVEEIRPVQSDEETNAVSAFVEVLEGGKSRGVWLLSSGLAAPQSFRSQGKTYQLSIRQRRHYYPFSLTLKEFRHDVYPGTDIPKNFSSLVQLTHAATGEVRDALIYMNHPLRYQGKTFYQASYGKGDRLSVFQVVENPAAWAPYISCTLVILGLAIQFLIHLLRFLKKQS